MVSDILSFLQTFLWIILIGVVLYLYHNQLKKILDAIINRIEKGSNVKVGPLELSEALEPQNSFDQKVKLDTEVNEARNINGFEVMENTRSQGLIISENDIRLRILQAEDLALRAIQDEFGISISRQLKFNKDMGIDGFFAQNGTGIMIEVKYYLNKMTKMIIQNTLENVFNKIQCYHWKNIKVLFVVVYDNKSIESKPEEDRIKKILDKYTEKLIIRVFKIDELANRYNIILNNMQ
jgi:hypothetical protein